MTRPVDGDGGFTLLELLVAISLLGLLSLVLWGGLRFGTQIWRTSDDGMKEGNRIRVVQSELTRMISGAYPAYEQADASHAGIAFDGGAHRLQFLAPDPSSPGAMSVVTLEQATDARDTVMRAVARAELATQSDSGTSRVLLRGLKSLDFSYFGSDSPQDESSWRAEWKDRTRPPELVRIKVAFADAKARRWPELVIKPQIEADSSCVLDPVAKYCVGR